LESLYNYALEVPDQSAVIIEHGQHSDSQQSLKFRLVALSGEQMGHGYTFYNESSVFSQNDRLTRAVFFNVPRGHYALTVESEDGYWLASESVFVDHDLISYVQTGSHLRE
jgi:hypothetical protein